MRKDIFEEMQNQHHQSPWNTSDAVMGPPVSHSSDTRSADSADATKQNPEEVNTSAVDSDTRPANSLAVNCDNGKYTYSSQSKIHSR